MSCSGRSNYVMFADDDLELAKYTPPIENGEPEAPKNSKEESSNNPYLEKELSRVFSEDYDHIVNKTILDPRGSIINTWNKIFIAACLTSLFVDPLFFLLPQVKDDICIHVSAPLEVVLTAIRTICDVFYVINIFIQFRTAYVAPSSRVFGRGELVVDPAKISSRYLRKDFWLDALAAQPIPQVLIWALIPNLRGPLMLNTRSVLPVCITAQFILRLCLVFPLATKINKATGVVLETAWAGAAYNLMLYVLASHVLGCLWYLLSIGRQEDCWRASCSLENLDCYYSSLNCRITGTTENAWLIAKNVSALCHPDTGFFEFGIYGDAVISGLTSTDFFKKFYYCLWWAMRNLNCFGQELSTSIYPGEVSYSMILGTLSLVLFGLLIANMQTYLQSNSARLEQWRMYKTDTERWMRHRHLPKELRNSVRRHNQHIWCATRGVDEETILKSLPTDLRRVIRRHLCLDLLRKVRLFDLMDQQMLDAICERLKPCLFDRATCLVREGDPVNEMLFIIRGRLDSYTTDGGRIDFFNSSLIGPGDFCGEELLTWALDPRSRDILPSSTRTVIAITEAEAFAFNAEDLKFIASQFRRHLNSKQLRYAFRFHSHQWRTWAACFIQAAWFRYKKLKEEAELKKLKNVSGPTMEKGPTLIRVASNYNMYSAKLAASTRRGGPKPQDPDFSE